MPYPRLRYSVQTLYTTALCILALQLCDWGSLGYLSPVLSVLTATKQLGPWQSVSWAVLYSSASCSLAGVLMGLSWHHKTLQLALVFFGTLAINKCGWPPLAKVFGGLCYMLGVLLPTTQGGYHGTTLSMQALELVLFTNIPILLTGFSLLFPVPMTSLGPCQHTVKLLCSKLSITLDSLVESFLLPDQADLHVSTASLHMDDAANLLKTLTTLQTNLSKERYLFPSLSEVDRMLVTLVPLLSQTLDTLRDLKEIGREICPNRTQEIFARVLHSPLRRFQVSMQVLLEGVVVDRISSVKCREVDWICRLANLAWSTCVGSGWKGGSCVQEVEFARIPSRGVGVHSPNDEEEAAGDMRGESDTRNTDKMMYDALAEYNAAMDCLETCAMELLDLSHAARVKYVFVTPSAMHSPSATPRTSRKRLSTTGMMNPKPTGLQHDNGQQQQSAPVCEEDDDDRVLPPPPQLDSPSSKLASDLYNENIWHGAYNLAPRGAFICQVRSLIHSTAKLKMALWPESDVSDQNSQSGYHMYVDVITLQMLYVFKSMVEFFQEPYAVWVHLRIVYQAKYTVKHTSIDSATRRASSAYLRKYLHPLKVALITTVASLLVISPFLRDIFPYGLWASIVVTLIRQDSSASSFHRGYQRVEGTLLGCLFAFSMSRMFNCTNEVACSDQNPGLMLPLLVLWIGLCALFRDDSQHGYASLVAGFTPIVVLLGPIREGTQDAAWARVEMTFLGVFLYLLIDNIILPNRSDHAIRKMAMQSVSEVRSIIKTLSESMNILIVVSASDKELAGGLDESDTDANVETVPGEVVQTEMSQEEVTLSTYSDGDVLAPQSPHRVPSDQRRSELLAACQDCLATTGPALAVLRQNVVKQREVFDLACNEPQLWFRYFSLPVYSRLLRCLHEVFLSSRSICDAHQSMALYLTSMPACNMARHMAILRNMNLHLQQVFVLAVDAFKCHAKALRRIFIGVPSSEDERQDETQQTLAAIISLSRSTEQTLATLNEEFRTYYFVQMSPLRETPLEICFVTHWQNLYGSTIYHVKKLTQLGVALHNVHCSEAGIAWAE